MGAFETILLGDDKWQFDVLFGAMLAVRFSINNLGMLGQVSKEVRAWLRYQVSKCNRVVLIQLLENMPATDAFAGTLINRPNGYLPHQPGELIWYKRMDLSQKTNTYRLYIGALWMMPSLLPSQGKITPARCFFVVHDMYTSPDDATNQMILHNFDSRDKRFGYYRCPMFDQQIKFVLAPPQAMDGEDMRLLKKRRVGE